MLSVYDLLKEKPRTEARIYVAGVPTYQMEVVSYDYKTAEEAVREACESVVERIKKAGGEASWEKVKL